MSKYRSKVQQAFPAEGRQLFEREKPVVEAFNTKYAALARWRCICEDKGCSDARYPCPINFERDLLAKKGEAAMQPTVVKALDFHDSKPAQVCKQCVPDDTFVERIEGILNQPTITVLKGLPREELREWLLSLASWAAGRG